MIPRLKSLPHTPVIQALIQEASSVTKHAENRKAANILGTNWTAQAPGERPSHRGKETLPLLKQEHGGNQDWSEGRVRGEARVRSLGQEGGKEGSEGEEDEEGARDNDDEDDAHETGDEEDEMKGAQEAGGGGAPWERRGPRRTPHQHSRPRGRAVERLGRSP